jgi:glycerophosphoryl diester phosphodiesterase
MPLLSQVFDLLDCYKANQGLAEHRDQGRSRRPRTRPRPREQFVQVVAREIREAKLLNRVTIQSFDWGALMRMRQVEPRLPIIALTNGDFLQVGRPGASPWLGGIDIDDFGGSLVAAAASFRRGRHLARARQSAERQGDRSQLRPVHHARLVAEAHAAGLRVIPWTVDDPATMASLIDAGVDGLITDYPDRLRAMMAERGLKLPKPAREPRRRDCLAEAHAL